MSVEADFQILRNQQQKPVKRKLPTNLGNLEFSFLLLLNLLSIWIGLTTSSTLLIAQALNLLEKTQQNIVTKYFANKSVFKFEIFQKISLIALSLSLTVLFWLYQWEKLKPEGMIFLSCIAIILNLVVSLRFKGQKFTFKTVLENWEWLAIFIIAIIILFTKVEIISTLFAFGMVFWVFTRNVKNLNSTINQAEHAGSLDTNEAIEPLPVPIEPLPEKILQEFLKIPKVEGYHSFQIIQANLPTNKSETTQNSLLVSQPLVTGYLVVSNFASQEDIFNIRNKAKSILIQQNFRQNILEIQYEAEAK